MFPWEVPSGFQLKFYEAGKQKYVHNLTALIRWESGTEFKTKLCHLNMRTHCAPDIILVTLQQRQMSHRVSLPGKGNSKERQLVPPISNIEYMFIKKYPNCEFLQLPHTVDTEQLHLYVEKTSVPKLSSQYLPLACGK